MDAGCPSSGVLFHIKRKTKLRFKYAVRRIIRQQHLSNVLSLLIPLIVNRQKISGLVSRDKQGAMYCPQLMLLMELVVIIT